MPQGVCWGARCGFWEALFLFERPVHAAGNRCRTSGQGCGLALELVALRGEEAALEGGHPLVS